MTESRRIRIKYFQMLWAILFLLFFRPASYVIGNTVNRMLNYIVAIIAMMLVIIVIPLKRYGYKIKRSVKLMLFLYFWCLLGSSILNTLIGNQIDYSASIIYLSTTVAFVLLCDIGFWYSPPKTLKAFLTIGILICSINAVTFFLYYGRGGMNHEAMIQYGRRLSENYFFLAEDNATYFWTWPVLVVLWIYYYMYNSKKRILLVAVAFTSLVTASYLHVWSVMAMIACISVPVILFVFVRSLNQEKKGRRHRKHREIQFWYMWVSGLAFNVLLSIGAILAYFQPIIQEVLHKRADLTGRTQIWERAYIYIAQSPIIGYGNEPAELSTMKILVNHTHNLFTETLYRGGIIGFIILVFLYISLSQSSKKAGNSIIYKFLYIMIFMFLIYSSVYFAFYRYHYLILLIMMAHNELFHKCNE